TEYMGSDSAGPWLTDKSLMPPLIAEYDRQMKQMEDQLKLYKRQMVDVKASLEQVIRENERLHTEKRISVERELESLSVGVEGDVATDVVTISNLEEQVKCAVEEKEKALQVWQVSTQELDRLQKLYQSTVRDSQLHTAEWQHVQNQLAQAQQLSQKLQATNQNLESTNHQFLKTVAEQNGELEQLRSQLRQAKQDLRVATVKVDEMTRLMQSIQDQMQRREEDAAEAHGREQASDHRLQQLQAVLNQLKAAAQEAECVRRDRARWERQVGDLQTRCAALEEEKFEAFNHVRASLQLAEEASLHRDQAQLREKQRVEELERMKEGMKQLVEEAAVRTRREARVDAVRKQCNTQIDRLAEELSALQLLYSEGRYGEPELRKIEALHQRCLNAERLKEEMELSLNTTHSTMKRQEMEFSEELSRCQEQVRCLQVALARAREESSSVSEERLRLQQDNQQLQKDMDTLRKECVLAQRQAKEQVSRVEQDLCVREQAVEARLRELEESSRTSSAGLKRLLLAQQKTTERYRDEARQLTHTFQNKIASLRSHARTHTRTHASNLEHGSATSATVRRNARTKRQDEQRGTQNPTGERQARTV
ncbi:hypothetical protein P4O66_012390, partial [Electrophorus voltai]